MADPKRDSGEQKPVSAWQVTKETWYEKAVQKGNLTKRKLDIVLALCFIVFVVTFAIAFMNRGYVVQFDSLGGTAVESQKLMYGDLITVESPTREGYEFDGWYKDILLENEWDLAVDKVEGPMTLYAGWEEKP